MLICLFSVRVLGWKFGQHLSGTSAVSQNWGTRLLLLAFDGGHADSVVGRPGLSDNELLEGHTILRTATRRADE